MYAGVIVLDGNRARFSVSDWKSILVIKALRARLREILTRSFKNPGKLPTAQLHTMARCLATNIQLCAGGER